MIGTVAAGTGGTLTNTVTAFVGGAVTDPEPANNTATIEVGPLVDPLFSDRFEGADP